MRGTWQHIKTGNLYLVTGTRIDCTNGRNNTIVVEYENAAGEKFCRDQDEFVNKFVSVSTVE